MQSLQRPSQNSHLGPGYEFITHPAEPQKKSFLPSGGGNKLVLIIAGLGVLTVLLLLIGLLSNRGGGNTDLLVTAAKQQSEIMKIADIGAEKGRDQNTKNIAVTTKLALQSQQADLLKLIKSQGIELPRRDLALATDKEAAQRLTTAEQNNQFDKVFMEVLNKKLVDYQSVLQKAHEGAKNKGLKETLAAHYQDVSILIGKDTEQ